MSAADYFSIKRPVDDHQVSVAANDQQLSSMPRFSPPVLVGGGHETAMESCSSHIVVIGHNALQHSAQIPLSLMRAIVRCPCERDRDAMISHQRVSARRQLDSLPRELLA